MSISNEILLALPELSLLSMACLVLVVDAFSKDPDHRITYWLTQISLAIVFLLVSLLFLTNHVWLFIIVSSMMR